MIVIDYPYIDIVASFRYYFEAYRDTFKIIPTEINAISNADPPWLINISGKPVSGKTPISAPILTKDCAAIVVTNPTTRSLPNVSLQLTAILYPLSARAVNNPIKMTAPTNPHSSAKTAKIESPSGSGT